MLSRIASTLRCQSAHLTQLTRPMASQASKIPAEVVEKYGPLVPVSMPRLKDVVEFPVPPLHRDYEMVWRRLTAWSCDYLERQVDIIPVARWDVAYLIGWWFAHCDTDAYLAAAKGCLAASYADHLYDYRWKPAQKVKFGQELMYWIQKMKIPKNAQFKPIVEMFADAYKESKVWLSKGQEKEMINILMKFAAAELFTEAGDHQTSVDKYIEHRYATYGSKVTSTFVEPMSGFTMPAEARRHSDVEKIYRVFNIMQWAPNDFMSFKFEQTRNDHWNNFITVYARQQSAPLQAGVDKLVELMNDSVVEFQRLMHAIVNSELCVKYPELKHYMEVGFANMFYGNLQMYSVIGRYQKDTIYLDKEAKRNDRIEPSELYSRIKT